MVLRLRTLIDVLQRDGLDGTPEQGLLRNFELLQQAALAEREELLELAQFVLRSITHEKTHRHEIHTATGRRHVHRYRVVFDQSVVRLDFPSAESERLHASAPGSVFGSDHLLRYRYVRLLRDAATCVARVLQASTAQRPRTAVSGPMVLVSSQPAGESLKACRCGGGAGKNRQGEGQLRRHVQAYALSLIIKGGCKHKLNGYPIINRRLPPVARNLGRSQSHDPRATRTGHSRRRGLRAYLIRCRFAPRFCEVTALTSQSAKSAAESVAYFLLAAAYIRQVAPNFRHG
jgi:hypothetical protein